MYTLECVFLKTSILWISIFNEIFPETFILNRNNIGKKSLNNEHKFLFNDFFFQYLSFLFFFLLLFILRYIQRNRILQIYSSQRDMVKVFEKKNQCVLHFVSVFP